MPGNDGKPLVADASVDLVYLDPPFNSSRAYNIIYPGDLGQVTAFEDTWYWTPNCDLHLEQMREGRDILVALVEAMGRESQMSAYLVNMAIRFEEMRRVLKPTGSLYLHCDPTASHYLKIVMDAIFGAKNFRNEIVWCYRTGGVSKRWFGRKHDTIFFYTKSNTYAFHRTKEKSRLSHKYGFGGVEIKKDDKGFYTETYTRDWWQIDALRGNQEETLGYPTQKPLALLERIVRASSNASDVVLDPFCGCATTIHAAQNLKRPRLCIDIST